MPRELRLRIGAGARCSNGPCGELSRIIINPVAWEVTHVVVNQKRWTGGGARLVPVDLADATTGQLRMSCTLAEFEALPPAQETEVVPDLDPTGHQDRPSVNFLPVSPGLLIRSNRGRARPGAPQQVTVDSVPAGGADIRSTLIVCATDGELGQVKGLLVEPLGRRVTHVLLRGSHLWGRTEVAVPISAVTRVGTLLIHLSLTRRQVKELP